MERSQVREDTWTPPPGSLEPAERARPLRRARRLAPACGALFLVIAGFVAWDIAMDAEAGVGGAHILFEAISLGLAVIGVVVAGLFTWRANRRAAELNVHLERSRAEAERWRTEAHGLLGRYRRALDEQFERWALTGAEREIAVTILKGLSYKEIAAARGTTERTVRHQALAIYRKARVSGRAEMAAFFLDAMLAPARDADARDADGALTPEPSSASVAPAR